jgi:hypothetical protein
MSKTDWHQLRTEFNRWLSDGNYRKPGEVFTWLMKKIEPDHLTKKQNRALHLYYKFIAEQFTNLGWQYNYVNPFTGEIIEIPWNTELIKEYIWRPIQIELTNKKSTTRLTTKNINDIIEVLDQHFASKGFEIEFPNWQSYLNKLEKEYFDKLEKLNK